MVLVMRPGATVQVLMVHLLLLLLLLVLLLLLLLAIETRHVIGMRAAVTTGAERRKRAVMRSRSGRSSSRCRCRVQ